MKHEPLLLEIGNSTMKLAGRSAGTFQITRFDDPQQLLRVVRSGSDPILCAPVGRFLSDTLLPQLPPERTHVITRESFRSFIGDSYDTPETLGLDRLLNLLGLGGDGVAISCGTAITVDALANGRPVWGAILPGFRTAADGLHQRVPALPHISPADAVRLPARTSHDSVANGVLLATALAVRGIAERLAAAAGLAASPVVVTGGDAGLLRDLWDDRDIRLDDALLFRGMSNWYRTKIAE